MRLALAIGCALTLASCAAEAPADPPGDAGLQDVTDVTDVTDVVDVTVPQRDVITDRATPTDARDAAADVIAVTDAPARDAPTDVPPIGPALYPADQAHSPITAEIAAGLRAIAATGPGSARVFAKVGDSNTVNTGSFYCFGGSSVDLGARASLRPTLDWFRAGSAAGTDPFRRASLSAVVGWSAWAALAGSPSPLRRELDAITPRYAVVMFGTNDIQSRDLHRYGQNLLDIADQCVARGVVPLFTSIPPRDDSAAADAWVPRYVAVMRGVAQSRQVPFIDLERSLRALPGHGMGPDGLHMNASPAGACALTDAGLRYGFNVRNLLTLEALDRARRALDGAPAPDADAPRLAGDGTRARPFEVRALPFADARDTRRGGERRIDRYPGCMSAADESGPEFVYRFTVSAPTRVRAIVLSRDGADIDVHLLGASVDGAACVARHDQMIVADVTPGTWHLVLDTFVASGTARSGPYVLAVMRD